MEQASHFVEDQSKLIKLLIFTPIEGNHRIGY